MIKKIEYTETYKETLSAIVSIIERDWGDRYVDRFLNQLDDVVEKIQTYPYLFQAIPIKPEIQKVCYFQTNVLSLRSYRLENYTPVFI